MLKRGFSKTVFLLLLAATLARAEETGNAEPRMAVRLGGFSPSLFKFVTTIPQKDCGPGGWQEAFAVLTFVDGRQHPTQKWTCGVRVGMPLRTELHGSITPVEAAETSALVATDASRIVMHRQPYWLTAEYCAAFHAEMRVQFNAYYNGIGARVGPS